MTLRKISLVLLALLLAAMAMVPYVSAADEKIGFSYNAKTGCSSEHNGCVEISEALSIASANVKLMAENEKEFADWNAASVRYSTTYYDLNNQITAYSFDVLVDGNYDGYILTSATTQNYPVLALSKAKIPDTGREYTEKTSKDIDTVAKRKDLTVGEIRPVYLGGLAFLHEYLLTDSEGNLKDTVYVDVRTGEIAEITDTSAGIRLPGDIRDSARILQERQADIDRSWSLQRRLVNGDSSVTASSKTRSLYTNTVSGVPLYFWRTGCSPTAAAMVLGYWQSHGYSNLPTSNTLIDELASAMGTASIWPFNGMTLPTRIDSGITNVAAQHGYYNLRGTSAYAPTFSDDMNEIDASRPFVISMLNGGTGAGRSTPYGQHSVACIGYMDSVPQLVKIYDTWFVSGDPTNYSYHWLQYGSWTWAMNTYARPI